MEVRFEVHLKIQTRLRDGRREHKEQRKQHKRRDQGTEGVVHPRLLPGMESVHQD